MKKGYKIRWIASLMLVSEVILIGFVIYWLSGQYRNQKEVLHEELLNVFLTSQEAVIDSMLVVHLINPILNDTVETGFVGAEIDSIHRLAIGGQKITIQGTPRWKNNFQRYSVTLNDSVHRDSSIPGHSLDPADDVLLRSAKLVFRMSDQSPGEHLTVDRILMVEPDTILFKTEFEDRLQSMGSGNFISFWYTASDSTPKLARSGIDFESSFSQPRMAVNVSKYSGYLLIKILPQTLFALLLALLTGFAFFFTYKNLRKQLEYNRIRDDFIGNISHELKTPVSTVKVAIEAIRNYRGKEDPILMEDYLSMAAAEVDRLDKLVETVLHQATMQEGGITLRLESVDLRTMIEGLVATLTPRFDLEQALVNFSANEGNFEINVDHLLIEGVLVNLIDNSLKYNLNKPEINIELYRESENTCVAVKDNGMGIPAVFRTKIFDKFFRIPTDNIHNIKGHGLGLSFASMVMALHSGKISVKDNIGGGTVFTISIPEKNGK